MQVSGSGPASGSNGASGLATQDGTSVAVMGTPSSLSVTHAETTLAYANLGVIARDAKAGFWLDRTRARERSLAAIKSLTIRVPGPEIAVGALSGGNQQKVLFSRLLATEPKVLILDEPTRGVDIGAKSEIYRIIDDLAKSGAAVLVISSELPEIVGIADRVVVMREGETRGEVGGASGIPITEENIMALATGVDMARVAA